MLPTKYQAAAKMYKIEIAAVRLKEARSSKEIPMGSLRKAAIVEEAEDLNLPTAEL